MVYLGLGIIAISATLYGYRYSRSWLPRRNTEHSLHLKAQGVERDPNLKDSSLQDESAIPEEPGEQLEQMSSETLPASRSSIEDFISSPQEPAQTTPKVNFHHLEDGGIPSLTLDGVAEKNLSDGSSQLGNGLRHNQKPLGKSPQAISRDQPPAGFQPAMPPPPRPTASVSPKPGISPSSPMPPPSRRPATASRTLPKASPTLLPPPSAASTLRRPPNRSLAPTASSLPPSSCPSKKVLLAPGHSPLDWAHLVTNPPSSSFFRGASVPPHLIRVPPSLLKYHNGRKGKDAWGVWQGKVYNMTPYMDFHPGGVDQLMRGAGKEGAEKLFLEIHPWVSWESMLGECLVGVLVSELEGEADWRMEEMD